MLSAKWQPFSSGLTVSLAIADIGRIYLVTILFLGIHLELGRRWIMKAGFLCYHGDELVCLPMNADQEMEAITNWSQWWQIYLDGLVQDCSDSSVLAMELLQSCTEPSICPSTHIGLMTYIDGLVQERCNSSALALELHLSCTNPLIYVSVN